METLLAFHLKKQSRKLLENLCASMDAVLVCPDGPDEKAPLFLLAGEKLSFQQIRPSSAKPVKLQEEMLVFCHFSDLHLDQSLALLRTAGMKETLKAVLTKENRCLNAEQLYGLLSEERRSLNG